MNGRDEQAVLIHLKGSYSPDELLDLEDALMFAVNKEGTGEFDGNEIGPSQTTLYLYGPDADSLSIVVQQILMEKGISEKASVILRYGGPGSPQKEIPLTQGHRSN
jgi:hypothetical protein